MKLVLILLISIISSVCTNDRMIKTPAQKFGEKVSYAGGKELDFSDFSIKFVGKREANYPTANSLRKMTFDDFEVADGKTKKTISWSSGTGDVAPTFFDIGGESYVLELGQSDIIKGSLGEGNLVIWRKSDYDEALKSKTK